MELNYVWELTEEGFQKIRNDAQESDIFGAFYVGRVLVEFRCANGGFDDEFHECVTDVYIYGEYDPMQDLWIRDVPYTMYDYDFLSPPKRRTICGFKRACERKMIQFLHDNPSLMDYAQEETVVEGWK